MSRKRVLIVEDNGDLMKLENFLLKGRGYEVCGVEDGVSAMEAIAEQMPDLILLGVRLPGMDGLEVCRYIKANPSTKDVPVVMLSAKTERENRERSQRAGVDSFITKPFKAANLIGTIQRLIGE